MHVGLVMCVQKRSSENLCIGADVQVADVLADSKAGSWIGVLCTKLSGLNSKCGYSETTTDDLCAVLSLPRQIQRALFSQMVQGTHDDLQALIKQLPVVLHGALISSLVTADGKLVLKVDPGNPLCLAAIHASHLELPAPGLLSLHLAQPCPTGSQLPSENGGDPGIASSISSAGILATSIASHARLKHLSLGSMRLKDHDAMVLCQQLVSLTQLQSGENPQLQ